MSIVNGLSQIALISVMNLRNLPQRLGTSSVAVFGVACVVGVFIGVLSMATGFQRTMTNAGAADTAIIMRSGATSELSSGMGHEEAQLLAFLPGVAQRDGEPLVSPEVLVIVDLPRRATNTEANVSLRGVQSGAFDVHGNITIVNGRRFEPGRNELLVGRGARHQFAGLEVGDRVQFGQSEWTVVGEFSARGGLSESEVWADAAMVQSTYRRGNTYQSVKLKLEDANGALEALRTAVAANPQLDLDVVRETDYLADQAEPLSNFIRTVGYPIAILMSLGAIFGAINTMYASVSTRTREIATLRALGFGGFPVAVSTLLESLVLSVIGGLLGALVVYLIFNGYTVSTINSASFSQVVFDFAVTIDLITQGITAAVLIGLVGGFFPALRAARMPVAAALRQAV